MKKYLEGQVAIVTGSGQGVGRGIALYLADQGAKVITNNRKPGSVSCQSYKAEELSQEDFEKVQRLRGDARTTADEIRRRGGVAIPFFGDVSDYETAGQLIETAISHFGRIDILVNNAAGLGQGSIIDTTEEQWEYMTRAKMKGAFNMMRHAVPYMIRQNFGRILNCASDAWTGVANLCAYSAGNSGVVGLTKAAAKELISHNITVNAYCPQAVSPGHVVEFEKTVRTLEERLGAGARPDAQKMKQVEADHGDAYGLGPFLAYLCTEGAGFISGSVFEVKASGKIGYYSEPKIQNRLWKQDDLWTIEELMEAVPEKLLSGYKSMAAVNDWGKTDEK